MNDPTRPERVEHRAERSYRVPAGPDWEDEFFAEMVASTAPIWDGLAAHFARAVA